MEFVATNSAPQAIGPYSQAVKANGMLYCSGQIPLSLEGELIDGDINVQAEQVLQNIKGLLEGAGTSMNKVVKTTVFLSDMNNFVAMNEIYAKHFGDHKPARSTVQVARLPKDVLVEIECIAVL